LTTKIVALVDALGTLARFVLLPGQRPDSIGVDPLISGVAFGALLADKAFDIDCIRADLKERGATAVIPPKADRASKIRCDFAMYRWHHLVENFFGNLKQFRRITTRYDPKGSAATRPIPATAPPFTWLARSSPSNECPQALVICA